MTRHFPDSSCSPCLGRPQRVESPLYRCPGQCTSGRLDAGAQAIFSCSSARKRFDFLRCRRVYLLSSSWHLPTEFSLPPPTSERCSTSPYSPQAQASRTLGFATGSPDQAGPLPKRPDPEIIHFHEDRKLALVRHTAGRTGARVVLNIREHESGQPGSLTDRGSASARAGGPARAASSRRSSARPARRNYVGASSSEANAASRRRQ